MLTVIMRRSVKYSTDIILKAYLVSMLGLTPRQIWLKDINAPARR